MVALMIMSILISIAYPSYTHYLIQTRRSDGQTALLDLANQMERYFTMNNTYSGATLATLGMTETSPAGFYALSINQINTTNYKLQAVPIGPQIADTTCGTLTFNQLGEKGITGTGNVVNCW